MTIAATVILYHPSRDVIHKVIGYAKFVPHLILVDNSEVDTVSALLIDNPQIEYHHEGINVGVASALNRGARRAVAKGFSWLLTLDQDTVLTNCVYLQLAERISQISSPLIAMVAPLQLSKKTSHRPINTSDYAPMLMMTSGSVLRLDAYKQCGPFLDKLFIDHVDHEYCLRLLRMGYRTVQYPNIILKHSLGEPTTGRFLWCTYTYTTHQPFRGYYFVRNGLYLAKQYGRNQPSVVRWLSVEFLKRSLKVLFLEDHKWTRFKMAWWGVVDFIRGRYGPGPARGIS